ncbi:MAG TPA: ribonucleoside triphosphate reductase, partial [Euryarchaeota archaeon]|nr:ribonucleoside triphosphate reductase [Euryarchaeota archaeon]
MNPIELVDSYLHKLDWKVKENANMSYSIQGLNFYISQEVVKQYWLTKVFPERAAKAHRSGEIHIHDLGFLGPYCVGWDLEDLLRTGFRGAPGKTESKPAKHFRVALLQIANFLYTMQGEAAGAQAFSNVDTYLAPFIYYDRLSYGEVKQAVQEFVFNMNVPTRVGFQTP